MPGQGDRVDTGVPGLDRVGTPLRVGDRPYLLVQGGRLLELTPFAYQVYRSSGPGARFAELELAATEVTRLRTVTGASQDVFPRDWPEDEVSPFTAPDAPCVRLTTGDDAAGYAELATATADGAEASGSSVTRTVGAGLGAVVRSSTGGVVGAGTTVLVDSTGTRYALGTRGGEQSAMAALGYGDVQPRAVPKAWLALFSDGPTLSTRAAGQLATGSVVTARWRAGLVGVLAVLVSSTGLASPVHASEQPESDKCEIGKTQFIDQPSYNLVLAGVPAELAHGDR